MSDPKIKYDIEAAVKGEADAQGLADTLRGVSDTLDGELQQSALDAAGALETLAAKQRALDDFARLRREAEEMAGALGVATKVVNDLGNALPQASANTQALASAERTMAAALAEAQASLDLKKEALKQLRDETTGTARRTEEFKTTEAGLRAAIADTTAEVRNRKADLTSTTQALAQATAAEAGLKKEYELAIRAATDASAAVGDRTRKLDESRGVLSAVGLSTTNLAQSERDLKIAIAQVRDEVATMAPAYQGAAAAAAAAAEKQQAAAKLAAQDAQINATEYANWWKNALADREAAEEKAAATAKQAANEMEGAFRRLGIQAIRPVEEEVQKLQAALAHLKNSTDVAPADKQAAVAAFNARLAELRTSATQAKPALEGVGQGGDAAAEGLKNSAQQLVAWLGAVAGLSQMKSLAADVVNTGAAFETLDARLTSLLGSAPAASEAMAMIKDLATTTPFEVQGLAESFVKLTAFGLQPTREQMVALTNTAASLGGGTETLAGVTLALGQAWAKGRLQGDEILQLTERGIPAWDALARATGRNVPELQRMSEAGLLGRDVISRLIDELGRMNMGASEKLMATYAGAVSNAKDALSEFYSLIASSGALAFLTENLRAALVEFDRMKETGELAQTARDISDGFVAVGTAVKSVYEGFVFLLPAIEAAIKVTLALKAVNIATSLYSMASGAVAAAAGMASVSAQSAAAQVSMVGATTAATGLASVLRLLRSLTGVGLALGVAELAGEFFRAKAAAEAGDAAVKKMLAEQPQNGPKKAAQEATQAIISMGSAAIRSAEDLRAAFEKMVAEGKKVDEALGAIGKDFDLSKAPGVAAAAQVLDGLVVAGKISAEQFADAWAQSLKGVDLADFEAKARSAFAGSTEGALRLQGALDASLREAIRRSGADFDELSGGMSRAAVSALNDTDVIITGLDRLRQQGVDVGAALEASLAKGISTASTQKELDAVRLQLESVRKVLGEKVTNDLLEQISDKSKKLNKDLQETEQAFARLGIKSQTALKDLADQAAKDFERVRSSGETTTQSLATAWKAMADAAIAANGGVATETIKAQAAMHGLQITTDAAGKSIVIAMNAGADSTQQFSGSVADARTALERMNDELERSIAIREKANELKEREAALERQRLNIDKEGFGLNTAGERAVGSAMSLNEAVKQAVSKGLAEADAYRIAKDNYTAGRSVRIAGGTFDIAGGVNDSNFWTAVTRKLDEQVAQRSTYGMGDSGAARGAPQSATTAKTYNVQVGARTIRTASDADAQALIGALRDAQRSA